MAEKYRVGLIGLGRPRNQEGWTGFGMAHSHAQGYNATGECEIVALCDIVEEKARLFGEEHAHGKATLYTDYNEMLAKENLDIVSIASWPYLHTPMVIAAAKAGVKGIHCEKPMAPTWGESKAMAAACAESGTVLTFDHQRRFHEVYQTARHYAQNGTIGEIKRLEGSCPNLFDWGTHWINMFGYYNNDAPAEWVMGQVDARTPRVVYGVIHDTQGVCVVQYNNGVAGTLYVGEGSKEIVGCANRIIGTDGTIEVHGEGDPVLVRGKGDGRLKSVENLVVPGPTDGNKAISRAIANLVHCLRTGEKPLLDVSNALATTEILFAAYESARRRGRINLPLTIEDSPLLDMVETGIFPDAKDALQKVGTYGSPSEHLLRGA